MAGRLWLAAQLRTSPFRLLAILALLSAGCGHASNPCPTPTTLLDRHRSESESLQEDLSRMEDEEGALRERRDEAAQRIEAARAAQDSLARASKKRRSR